MKLNPKELFNVNGEVEITERGWLELQNFCKSVIYKRVGKASYTADLISTALIKCVESLSEYDSTKNDQVAGFLYYKVLGVISTEANKARWEIPTEPWRLYAEKNPKRRRSK